MISIRAKVGLLLFMAIGVNESFAMNKVEAFQASATYYSNYYNGRKMSNGKRFSQSRMTAAHPSLKLGSRVKVIRGNRSIVVTITDRCRCSIDLSQKAFRQLAPLSKGRIKVFVKKF